MKDHRTEVPVQTINDPIRLDDSAVVPLLLFLLGYVAGNLIYRMMFPHAK